MSPLASHLKPQAWFITGTDPAYAHLLLLAILSLGDRAQLDRKIEKFLRPNPTLIFTFVHNQKHRSIGR
ncbi:MAG: hypothetical protein ACKO9Q_17805, partial [Pirellula sp.]